MLETCVPIFSKTTGLASELFYKNVPESSHRELGHYTTQGYLMYSKFSTLYYLNISM